uniref:WD_REPEATS_REGION domain-containing protein n=1 Tax=Macrostomum lignano TaxID=282301 RepID=A0A1I8I1F5_9PLAT
PNPNFPTRHLQCHSRRLLAVGPLTGGSLTGSRSSALLGTGSETGEIKIWLATLAAGKIEMQQVLSCKHTSEVAVLELVQLPGEQEPALLVGDRTGRLEICRVLAKVNEASL